MKLPTDLHTILAALQAFKPAQASAEIQNIATNEGLYPLPSPAELADLTVRLNLGGIQLTCQHELVLLNSALWDEVIQADVLIEPTSSEDDKQRVNRAEMALAMLGHWLMTRTQLAAELDSGPQLDAFLDRLATGDSTGTEADKLRELVQLLAEQLPAPAVARIVDQLH